MPCRIHVCSGTWVYRPAEQLVDLRAGRKPPKRLCPGCMERLAALEDRQVPCKNPGCGQTWTFTRFEQLLFERLGKPVPQRACPRCENFLRDHPTTEIPCTRCGAPIVWTSEAQLMAELGQWVRPELCAECKAAEVRGRVPA